MSYVIITGASSGIGKSFAYVFAKMKYDLLLVARRGELLREIAEDISNVYKVNVDYLVKDISQNNNRNEIIAYIREKNYNVAILVNNAGFGSIGVFKESKLGIQQKMIDVNVSALMHFTYEIFPHIEQKSTRKDKGYILNVGSIAGFIPGPYMANYYASKAYVLSFTEALSEECKQSKNNVIVSVLCPGPVQTEFSKVANFRDSSLFEKMFNKGVAIPKADDVAAYAVKKMFQHKCIILYGNMSKLLLFLHKVLPRSIIRKIVAMFQKRRII